MSGFRFRAGDRLCVKYQVASETVHERLVIARIIDSRYLILTPDGDFYEEDYSDTVNVRWVRMFHSNGDLPYGVNNDNLHGFDEQPTESEFNSLVDEARAMIERIADDEGFEMVDQSSRRDDTVRRPNRRDGVLVREAEGGERRDSVGRDDRRRDEETDPTSERRTGTLAEVSSKPSGGLAALRSALGNTPGVASGSPSSEGRLDARVLPVKYDAQGERFREFRDGVALLEKGSFSYWPVLGPLTIIWVCKWLVAKAYTPLMWHQQWKSIGKLSDSDPWVIVHETCMRMLEVALAYDQLDVSSLASFEILARQIQTIEERLKDKFVDAKSAGSDIHLMMGMRSKTELCICPELTEYIADELRKETAVLKEKRKAREERGLTK